MKDGVFTIINTRLWELSGGLVEYSGFSFPEMAEEHLYQV